MNHNFYFDGRQIKNYLIGFASIFSEIPYKNRKGILESVPIHYGSPSDIISHLEMNVDNEETANRNRLKDITVPMFSFRMTGIERNPEKRRAPHDSITVDLRPLGYSNGYVAMRPSPIKFTMELVCWASSDYQAFEIAEQIIPYFNSPQQINIEPLPKCPISTSEVFLESVEIDTDPESQKYAAMINMSFTMNGWLLTQPRIWSTNMKFEFQMLDKNYKGSLTGTNLDETDWSVGHDIVDANNTKPPENSSLEKKLISIENFIKSSPLNEIYSEKIDLYFELIKEKRISDNGQIIDITPIELLYKDKTISVDRTMMEMLIDDFEEVNFLYTNEILHDYISYHTLSDDLDIYNMMIEDDSDALDVYFKLLDSNVVTLGFNKTEVPFSNSDKLNMFGSTRIDIDSKLDRLKTYLSGIENIKIQKEKIISTNILNDEFRIFTFNVEDINFDDYPETFKIIDGVEVDKNIKDVLFESYKIVDNKLQIRMKDMNENASLEKVISLENKHEIITVNKNLDNTFDITLDYNINKPVIISVTTKENMGFNPIGIIVNEKLGYEKFDELEFDFNSKSYNLSEINFIDNIEALFDGKKFLDEKFTTMDQYVISSIIMKDIERTVLKNKIKPIEAYTTSKYKSVYEKKYSGSFEKMIRQYAELKNVINGIEKNITKLENNSISENIVGTDLSQQKLFDKNGNEIFDINNDSFIDTIDLELLGSEVDNKDDYNFEIKDGILYKKQDGLNISDERIKKIIIDLRILIILLEKDDTTEFKEYIDLYSQGLLIDDFNIKDDENSHKELIYLGYDLIQLDDTLSNFRMFIESIKTILIREKDYIINSVPDMNEDGKKMLFIDYGLDIDKILYGVFINKYFKSDLTDEQRFNDMSFFRKHLSLIGEYIDYGYLFESFINDIKKTQLFKDSLLANTPWIDDRFPNTIKEINEKYLIK